MRSIDTRAVINDKQHTVFTAQNISSNGNKTTSLNSPDRFESSAQNSTGPQKTVFARMNESWFTKTSENTHAFFQKKPEDWQAYHATFREARKTWEATPADEMIKLYFNHPHLTIGDFGCGEGMIGQALSDRHTVHSFDHVSANKNVVACDISQVPLADGALDVAIFSLALMGDNFTKYVDEAHRTLALGGKIHILEMSRRFTDREGFIAGLERKGFVVEKSEDMWKFTHITAVKTTPTLASSETLIF